MGRRDGERKLGAGQNGDGSTHLGRETTGGGHVGDLVTKSAHDMVTISHQTQINGNTTESQDPHGHGSLGDVDVGILPDVVDGGKGADGVGDVVGTVSKGSEASRDDLDGREEALGIRVKLCGVGMDFVDVSVLGRVDVVVKTSQGLLHQPLGKVLLVTLLQLDKGRVGLTIDLNGGIKVLLALDGGGLSHLLLEDGGLDAFADERSVENVVPLEILIVLDLATQEGAQEEQAPGKDNGAYTDGDSSGDTDRRLLEVRLWCALEDDVKDVDHDCNTKVGGDGNQTTAEGIVMIENHVFREQEEDGADQTGSDGRDDPGKDNLGDT